MNNNDNTSIEKTELGLTIEEEKSKEHAKFIKEKSDEIRKQCTGKYYKPDTLISPVVFLNGSTAGFNAGDDTFNKELKSDPHSTASLPLTAMFYLNEYNQDIRSFSPNAPINFYAYKTSELLASSTANNLLSYFICNLTAYIDRSFLMTNFPEITVYIKNEIIFGLHNDDNSYGFLNNATELIENLLGNMKMGDRIAEKEMNTMIEFTANRICLYFLNNVSYHLTSFIDKNMNNSLPNHIFKAEFEKAVRDGDVSSKDYDSFVDKYYTATDIFCDKLIKFDGVVAKLCNENPMQINAICCSWLKDQVGMLISEVYGLFPSHCLYALKDLKKYNLNYYEEYQKRIYGVQNKYLYDKNDENNGTVNCVEPPIIINKF
jgi:hypothetical protein